MSPQAVIITTFACRRPVPPSRGAPVSSLESVVFRDRRGDCESLPEVTARLSRDSSSVSGRDCNAHWTPPASVDGPPVPVQNHPPLRPNHSHIIQLVRVAVSRAQ